MVLTPNYLFVLIPFKLSWYWAANIELPNPMLKRRYEHWKGLSRPQNMHDECGNEAWDKPVPNPRLKLLDQVRQVMRLHRYSLHT